MRAVALLIAGTLALGVMSARAEDGLTLKDCYGLALKRSETVAIQQELIKETEGVMLQSLSTALPKVAFAYAQKWQDIYQGNSIHASQGEGKFTFTQPLFTGFREFAAIGASKHIGKQRAAELKRARELLLTDVADAFYLYLSFQEDEKAQLDIKRAIEDRLGDLKRREQIGKSRKSEVVNTEARLLRLEASLESTRAQRDVAAGLLEFLIGREPGPLLDDVVLTEDWSWDDLSVALDQRADVTAAREAVETYKLNTVAARAAFFPTVALSGNSYVKRFEGSEGNDWDITLGVSMPIFNGLNDVGQVCQARAQKNEAELRLSQVRRLARMDLKNAYVKLQAHRRRLAALDKAVASADENERLQGEDFQKSLVNNLDVLQAIEDLQGVRRDRIAAKADAARAYWALKVAAGRIEP